MNLYACLFYIVCIYTDNGFSNCHETWSFLFYTVDVSMVINFIISTSVEYTAVSGDL